MKCVQWTTKHLHQLLRTIIQAPNSKEGTNDHSKFSLPTVYNKDPDLVKAYNENPFYALTTYFKVTISLQFKDGKSYGCTHVYSNDPKSVSQGIGNLSSFHPGVSWNNISTSFKTQDEPAISYNLQRETSPLLSTYTNSHL
jgi:hypothetical protein